MLKNITLSADEELIEKARKRAQADKTTLNASFRQWLKTFANSSFKAQDYDELMQTLSYVKSDKKYTRDELNER